MKKFALAIHSQPYGDTHPAPRQQLVPSGEWPSQRRANVRCGRRPGAVFEIVQAGSCLRDALGEFAPGPLFATACGSEVHLISPIAASATATMIAIDTMAAQAVSVAMAGVMRLRFRCQERQIAAIPATRLLLMRLK